MGRGQPTRIYPGGGEAYPTPPPARPESMLENCCKSAQIRAQNRLQNHFKTSSQEVLQTQCKSGSSFAKKIHEKSPRTRSFDCSEPLKLLYFTAVLNISQCSQATPTMLVTDMKTCVRDLMFDPETIEIVWKISAQNLLNFSGISESLFHRFSDPKTPPKSPKNHAVDPQAEPCWSKRLRKGHGSSQTFN